MCVRAAAFSMFIRRRDQNGFSRAYSSETSVFDPMAIFQSTLFRNESKIIPFSDRNWWIFKCSGSIDGIEFNELFLSWTLQISHEKVLV